MFYPINGGSKVVVGESVGEHFLCHLPPLPQKSFIINNDLPREEQYWRRQPLPDFYFDRRVEEEYRQLEELKLVSIGKRKSVAYVDPILERYRRQEWNRRQFGVYIMINGQPVYLTNDHYMYLQWSKFDHLENNGYPFYYEFSRDNHYIRKWSETNPRSLGYMFIGPRATGKSNEEIATIASKATRLHNQRAALQSKHFENDAKGVLIQAKMVPLFNHYPDFFKPVFSHGTNTTEELVFTRSSVKGIGNRLVQFGPDHELNSRIFAAPPGEKALDTDTLSDLFEDEIGKQDPKGVGDIYVRHETNVRCVFRNHRKIGLMRKTSTVEEMNEGGEECNKLWKDSDDIKLDNNGWTISKIHRHLISALDTDTSLEDYIDLKTGKNWGPPCDIFGRIDREIANIKIENDLDAVKHDLKKMSSRMRKSPRNATEAFISDQSKSIFNIQLLSARLNHIRNVMKEKPYVRGDLYWLKEKFGPVGFTPNAHSGRFNWAWFPDEYRKHNSNPAEWKILNNIGSEWGFDKKGKSRLLLFPKNDHLFRVGGDPLKLVKTKDPRASKASIHGFRMFDFNVDYGKEKKDWQSHNFIFEYINRPDDPAQSLEDAAMACIFLGCKMLPERNVTSFNNYFEDNGLEKFLFYPNEHEQTGILDVQNNSDEAGYATSTEVIQAYTTLIIQFINEHIGRMPFDDTIEDWSKFDSLNPTKSDPTVSSGYTLVHANKTIAREVEEPENMNDWFDAADNSGSVGRLIESED